MFQEDGSADYIVKDAAGNPIQDGNSWQSNSNKLARISPQTTNDCITGMAQEFYTCLGGFWGGAAFGASCILAIHSAVPVCAATLGLGCAGMATLVIGACGFFPACFYSMVDDPPTYVVSKAEPGETLTACWEGNLVRNTKYTVQVDCQDDRQLLPSDPTIQLLSGETREFICEDCGGYTTKGSVSAPDNIETITCDFGCQNLGRGMARCLEEGETPQEIPNLGIATNIPAGTYEGTTDLGNVWKEAWGGEVVTNELIVIVADDGAVSGSFTSLWDGGPAQPVDWGDPPQTCVSQIYVTENGTFSGKLTDVTGTINVQTTSTKEIRRNGCPAETEIQTDSGDFSANITISGDIMTGTVPDYSFTFEATKQ
jgi:hypothetical protein